MNKNSFTFLELPQDAIVRLGSGYSNDLAVSADGTSLAVGSWVGVWWYDLATRQPVTLFETGRGMVDRVALCSSQPLLAVKNTDKDGNEVIKIWDMQRQKRIAVMEYPARLRDDPPQNDLCSLCFSPSGQWLAASRYGSVVVDIYESLTGRLRTSLELPAEEIALCSIDDWRDNGFHWAFSGAVAFSPDDRFVASSHWSDFISVWDITTCERIIRITGHPEGVHSLSFSPCSQFLAAGGVKGTIQVWDTSTWQLQQTYPSTGDDWMDISYAPDGSLRAAGISHDLSSITLWDVAQQKDVYTFHEKNYYDAEIFPIHFSNGTHLALKSDFEVQVKTVGDAESLSILPWELGDLHSMVFSPDGKTLCAGYRQFGGVVLWDVTTHRPQRVVTEPRCHIVAVYSDTATGKFYATGYPPGESDFSGNTLNLWEVGQSEPIAELTIPGDPPNRRHGMAYAPATNLLACGDGTEKDDESWEENDHENGAVYVWDVARGQMRHIFRGKHADYIHYVKFSPDGTRLISRDFDDTVRLWDVICGEEIGELEDSDFFPIVFFPCGNLIAGYFSYGRILVWDIESCEARVTIHTNFACIDPIKISPCGQYMAYGEVWKQGLEKVPVRLWDIRTGENIATFLGHPTDIQCLAFSPDSTLLASGGFDGVIYLWDLKPYLRNT
ncbi:MAG: WD40 repeat domain-containing protein [Candidatus Poribacteria bacterium]|nr:WD40 repeat domain-containing protein [Candidatus Poribacteria bacterium]